MEETRVRELFAVIDAERWDRLGEFFATDAVYERPGIAPLEGLERIVCFYTDERVIASGTHHVEQVVVSGGAGASWGSVDCVLKDGSQATERFADAYLFSDGKISLRRSHFFRPAV